jgi:hypothetical protein
MKHAFIVFLVGIFLIIIGVNITQKVMPFSEEQIIAFAQEKGYLTDNELLNGLDEIIDRGLIFRMIDSKSLIAFLLVWSSAIVCIFASFHLAIDKFFFKQFYQPPNAFNAYRRGALIALCLLGLFFLRMLDSLEWYNALAIFLLAVFIELFVSGLSKEKTANISQN